MVNTVSLGYVGSAKVARLSSLRVAAEPGPRYRASGAAAARPGGRLAQPPLPPQAAYVGLVFVAAARRYAPTSPAPPRLAYGPPALATRPFVLSPRTAKMHRNERSAAMRRRQ